MPMVTSIQPDFRLTDRWCIKGCHSSTHPAVVSFVWGMLGGLIALVLLGQDRGFGRFPGSAAESASYFSPKSWTKKSLGTGSSLMSINSLQGMVVQPQNMSDSPGRVSGRTTTQKTGHRPLDVDRNNGIGTSDERQLVRISRISSAGRGFSSIALAFSFGDMPTACVLPGIPCR